MGNTIILCEGQSEERKNVGIGKAGAEISYSRTCK
jgi:hypothetical protein